MTTRPPAEIGMSLDEVDTPALIVDLDAFERNLRRLADRVQGSGVRLRPHAKTHKCPVIALKQIELGAVGVCCQKVSEAEAMVYGGVPDVLVTNEIVGRQKLRRLMALAGSARIGVCVDDPAQIADLEAAAKRGRHRRCRCMSRSTWAATAAASSRASRRSRWRGDRRRAASALRRAAGLSRLGAASAHLGRAAEGDRRARSTRRGDARPAGRQAGIACDNITGAGTGTFEFEAASGVYTELQCGSYIFMDADYGRNLDRDGAPIRAFEPSLFVWATVMSRPADDRAIVDAGLKALAFDSGPPTVWDEPAATYERASDEHGRLGITGATNRLSSATR